MKGKAHKSIGLSNLIISVLIIAMLVSVIVGATFAIFSDTKIIKDNTITSGNVAIETKLTAPTSTSGLDGSAALGTFGLSDSNAIEITNMAAGDSGTYTLNIKNVGNLAAIYRIAISGMDTAQTGDISIFIDATQLDLSNSTVATDWFAALNVNSSVDHNITISMSNSASQQTNLKFDITVYAVQSNATDYIVFADNVDALKNAPSGSTVVLMKDIESLVDINVKGINIDFNGHKITCPTFNLTDNEIKTITLGKHGDAGDTSKGGFVGDVNIVANNATVHFYTNIEGALMTATASNSMHFSGAFVSFSNGSVVSAEITVTGGRLVLEISDSQVIPAIAVGNNAQATNDITIVVPENITVPKITIPESAAKNVVVENKGTVTELENNNTSPDISIEVGGNKPNTITGGGSSEMIYKAATADELIALIANAEVKSIALSADIELKDRITVSRSININGNGFTLSTVLSDSSNVGIIYITKNTNEISVNIENLSISGKSIPGISYDTTQKMNLNITNTSIDTFRYGIHSRGSENAVVNITDCNINSWGAYYARGSKNETTTINNSILTGTNIYNGLSNSFATISIQYGSGGVYSENVHLSVKDSTISSITKSDQDQSILSIVSQEGEANRNDGTQVDFTNCITKLGDRIVDLNNEEDRNIALDLQDWGLKYYNDATLTNLVISVNGVTVPCYINGVVEAYDAWDLNYLLSERKAPKIYIAYDIHLKKNNNVLEGKDDVNDIKTFTIDYPVEIIGYDGVTISADENMNIFTIEAMKSGDVVSVRHLIFDNIKGKTKGIMQDFNTSSDYTLNVEDCVFNIDASVAGTAGTGICIAGTENKYSKGVTLNVTNTDILFNVDNKYASHNRRGISVFYTDNANVNIVDSHIQSTYAINLQQNTNLNLSIENTLVEGWSAIILVSSSSNIKANKSVFKGYNSIAQGSGANDYATIVVDGGNILGYSPTTGNQNDMLFTDCEIHAIRMEGCHDEYFVSVQYGAAANKIEFVNTTFTAEGNVEININNANGESGDNVLIFNGKKGQEGWKMTESNVVKQEDGTTTTETALKTYDSATDSWVVIA